MLRYVKDCVHRTLENNFTHITFWLQPLMLLSKHLKSTSWLDAERLYIFTLLNLTPVINPHKHAAKPRAACWFSFFIWNNSLTHDSITYSLQNCRDQVAASKGSQSLWKGSAHCPQQPGGIFFWSLFIRWMWIRQAFRKNLLKWCYKLAFLKKQQQKPLSSWASVVSEEIYEPITLSRGFITEKAH